MKRERVATNNNVNRGETEAETKSTVNESKKEGKKSESLDWENDEKGGPECVSDHLSNPAKKRGRVRERGRWMKKGELKRNDIGHIVEKA